MKHRIVTTLMLVSGLALSSCLLNLRHDESGAKTELEEISVNNDYAIGIPMYMTKTSSLNEDASLQFQNIFKEVYVIVIDEKKDLFIQAYKDVDSYDTTRSVILNYADTQTQLTVSNLEVISKSDIRLLKINGLDAAMVEIDGLYEGISQPLTYFLTFVEGDENLYLIMQWTLFDRKEDQQAVFDKIARSFRTLRRGGPPV